MSVYLARLAEQVGYQLDPDELDPVTGFHPGLVIAWVRASARHAGLAHARQLLDAPIDFLREQHDSNTHDLHACQLADLLRARDRLDRELPVAAGAYAAACAALAETGLGLIWPDEPGTEDTARTHAQSRPGT